MLLSISSSSFLGSDERSTSNKHGRAFAEWPFACAVPLGWFRLHSVPGRRPLRIGRSAGSGAPFVKTQFRTQNRVPTFAGTALGAVDKGALHTRACVEAESLLFGGEFAARMVNRTLREGLVKAHRQVFVAYSVMLLMLIFIDDVR